MVGPEGGVITGVVVSEEVVPLVVDDVSVLAVVSVVAVVAELPAVAVVLIDGLVVSSAAMFSLLGVE